MNKRSNPARLALLISGGGTIVEAVAQAGLDIGLVVADRPCAGLERAKRLGLETLLLERTDFSRNFNYAAYSQRLARELQQRKITKVAMAGWMTLLAAPMFEASTYAGRILNTHPSLLPKYPGAHAVRDALVAGVTQTGCTVHVATPELDAGPIVAQQAVPVLPNDNESSLHERIKQAERQLYSQVIGQWLAGGLAIPGLVG